MRTTIAVLFVATAATLSLPAQTWITSPVNGHQYALTQTMSWHQARDQARAWGGELATVRSQAQDDWLWQTFGKLNWIGLNDEAQEGTFVWVSGEPVVFTNWCINQPDNSNNADFVHTTRCVGMLSTNGWADLCQSGCIPMPGIVELIPPPITATFTPFGTGCASTAGVPVLAAQGSSLPKVGTTFSTTVSPLGLTSLPFGLLGVSNTAWSGLPLPLDLTLIGMQGCDIYVSVDVSMRLAVSGSSATWDLPIPNTSNLLGQSLYQQAFVIDPLGSATSNAGTMTIGY